MKVSFLVALRLIAAVLIASLPFTACAAEQHDTRNILVYGDSLTWGWVPTSPAVPSTRYPEADRWPVIMAKILGDEYNVVTEGLYGRTTNADAPNAPGLLSGANHLQSAVVSHEPLDLVIIMLGTNDVKTRFHRSANEIGLGLEELIEIVKKGSGLGWTKYETPDILVISPPPFGHEIDPQVKSAFVGSREKIAALPAVYSQIAEKAGVYFFDAATVVQQDEVGPDGIHLLVKGNRDLGEAVAARVVKILE